MCPYTARYQQQIGLLHERMGECGEDIAERVQKDSMSEDCKQRLKEKLTHES